jgi:hypothetical protein
LFDQTLNLSTVAFLLFIVVLATTAYVVGLERQHREETSKLEAKIAAQDNQIREQDIQITELRDMVIHMRERMWPGESHGNSTSINVSGGQGVFGSSAGRDVNQANAGGK